MSYLTFKQLDWAPLACSLLAKFGHVCCCCCCPFKKAILTGWKVEGNSIHNGLPASPNVSSVEECVPAANGFTYFLNFH